MITYLQTIKDTKTRRCDQSKWEEMVNSPQTAEYIKQYRKTKNIDWKQRLPAVNFQGYDPKVLKGLEGSRKQADMLPTGLFMLDIDHTTKDLNSLWLATQDFIERNGGDINREVALVHITPSGEGLRIVMKPLAGGPIAADQEILARELGVKHDVCTKDLSRWSFVPQAKDILFINPKILFSPTPTLPPGGGGVKNDSADVNPYARAYANKSDSADVNPYAKAYANKSQTADENSQLNSIDNLSPTGGGAGGGLFPSTYRGISYEKIVEALIQYHGGTPEVGERHHTIITLANDLRSITDSNVDWLVSLIPNFDKPDYEKRDAVTWAVQHNSLRRTKALSAVLDWLQNGKEFTPEQASEEEINDLDEEAEVGENRKKSILDSIPKLPEKLPRLVELLTSKVMDFQKPALAQMIFPPLAAHVPEACFVLEENKPFELSLMGILAGQQSVGKGGIDKPVEIIMEDIAADDEKAEEEWAAYDEYENTKGSNEKGKKKPTTPIRILETNASYSAILTSFINCVKGGYAKNLCCFTKCEEIEELYDMGVTNGRQKVMQLCKKTYDRGRIGANRSTSIATKGHAPLRWNWLSSTTPGNARKFFKKSLTDGTVSRIDFSLMLPPADLKKFVYGDYDDDFYDELEPYIRNLRDYRGQWDKRGHLKPLKITQLFRIDEEMSVYIDEYSKTMPDDTWKNFAWRTKLNEKCHTCVLYDLLTFQTCY
ncbi:MAG: hypothetical protein MJZ32_06150 [Bacteroidaceae bacterium]|nr:hypothetical protein [Bacteroidaceae bacterium]